MKNITIAVDDAVYLAARRKAAEQSTSVSRLVADFLRSLSREDELRAERNGRLAALFTQADRRGKGGKVGRLNRGEIYAGNLR